MPQNYRLFSIFYELFPKQNSLLDYYHKPPEPITEITALLTLKVFTGTSATCTFTGPHPNMNTKHKYLTFLPSPINGEKYRSFVFQFLSVS